MAAPLIRGLRKAGRVAEVTTPGVRRAGTSGERHLERRNLKNEVRSVDVWKMRGQEGEEPSESVKIEDTFSENLQAHKRIIRSTPVYVCHMLVIGYNLGVL